MKFKITMKDPDGVYESVQRAAEKSVEGATGLCATEKDRLIESRHADLMKAIAQWFEYSEYLDVEIDTEAKTATVVPRK